jgi:hypothetical protein
MSKPEKNTSGVRAAKARISLSVTVHTRVGTSYPHHTQQKKIEPSISVVAKPVRVLV